MVTKGQYIKLENKDWRGDARGFCQAIKALEGVTFNPAEMDEDNWWFIPAGQIPRVHELYYQHIDKVLQDLAADRRAGFVPAAKSGRFARRRVV